MGCVASLSSGTDTSGNKYVQPINGTTNGVGKDASEVADAKLRAENTGLTATVNAARTKELALILRIQELEKRCESHEERVRDLQHTIAGLRAANSAGRFVDEPEKIAAERRTALRIVELEEENKAVKARLEQVLAMNTTHMSVPFLSGTESMNATVGPNANGAAPPFDWQLSRSASGTANPASGAANGAVVVHVPISGVETAPAPTAAAASQPPPGVNIPPHTSIITIGQFSAGSLTVASSIDAAIQSLNANKNNRNFAIPQGSPTSMLPVHSTTVHTLDHTPRMVGLEKKDSNSLQQHPTLNRPESATVMGGGEVSESSSSGPSHTLRSGNGFDSAKANRTESVF